MTDLLLDQSPRDVLGALHLNHEMGGVQVICGRKLFKALGNKDFNISCYLLVLGPAFEFQTPDVGDGRGEAVQSLALFAVNYPTTENLVVVNAIGLDVHVVARVGFEVGQSVID